MINIELSIKLCKIDAGNNKTVLVVILQSFDDNEDECDGRGSTALETKELLPTQILPYARSLRTGRLADYS
jgi:hypothetical protein